MALRHHLAAPARASSPLEVARDMVALHATDPASVFLACWSRLQAPDVRDVERALYEERCLVRMLGMRRTMWVVPADLVGAVQAGATRPIAARERARLLQHLQELGGIAEPSPWLDEVCAATLAALAEAGQATGAELSAREPRLRTSLSMAPGKPYAAQQNITTRVLTMLSADGHIVRGRPRGSWTSSQHRWATTERWLGGEPAEPSPQDGRTELVRRWLRTFGPATQSDLRWWTGWTARDVKAALAGLETAPVDLDGEPGLALADDLEPVPAAEPWPALLPALDPTVMGWSDRRWFLGAHAPLLFDRSGNAGPTVWWNGRVVGGWAQRRDGGVVVRLLEDVGTEAAAAVEAERARLEAWIGDVRVTPRFRTPLERELTS